MLLIESAISAPPKVTVWTLLLLEEGYVYVWFVCVRRTLYVEQLFFFLTYFALIALPDRIFM